MVAANDRIAIMFKLSEGQRHDAPQGRELLRNIRADALCAKCPGKIKFLADRAYADDATRKLVKEKGFDPVIPPKSNRKEPWVYDKEKYKKCNEIERLFGRVKRFRRIFRVC
jgi:transposase